MGAALLAKSGITMVDQLMDAHEYANGKRVEGFFAEKLGAVLTSGEAVRAAGVLLSRASGVLMTLNTTEAQEQAIARAVKAGIEGSQSPTSAIGRAANMSSAIASLAAMCFPSVGTLPETSRATNLDKTKHVAYKAALVCFLHEFPGQGEDFTGKFCLSLTTKSCEYNKDIRTVFFDSLEKTLRVVRDENLEEEEEEESESVVAVERACVATYAILKDHVFDKWKQHALGTPGELAAKAFKVIRNNHEDHPLEKIFSLPNAAAFDDKVTSFVMFATVTWLMEVLNADRIQYNTDNPAEESQESECNTVSPELADRYEAPGFNAMNRAQQWVGKYRKPATGGGKPGGSKRAKTKSRAYLETVDDQAFNRSVRERLGKLVKGIIKSKNLTTDSMTSKEVADKLLRPYRSVSTQASAAAGSAAAEGAGAAGGAAGSAAAEGAGAARGAAGSAATEGAGAAGGASG